MSPKQISRAKFLENAELQKKLLTYSAAASLALAGVTLAPVTVVADVDPDDAAADAPFEINADSDEPPAAPGAVYTRFINYTLIGGYYPIDFDGDGDREFDLGQWVVGPTSGLAYLWRDNATVDVGVSFVGTNSYPWPLPPSTWIPGAFAWSAASPGTLGLFSFGGLWPGAGVNYLGLRFQLDGNPTLLYGWARLMVGPQSEYIWIDRLAYNPTGAPIQAGFDANAVTLAGAEAASGGSWLQAAVAGSFAVLGGVLAWLRQRVGRKIKRGTV